MIEFHLPDTGEGITEVEVVRWLAQEGERVQQYEPMVEVQTDKALVELQAPNTGYIQEIKAPSGTLVKVGELLVVIDDEDVPFGKRKLFSKSSKSQGGENEPAQEASQNTSPKADSDHVNATPGIRQFAREMAVDLSAVTGSGPNGRIERADIERYIQEHQALVHSQDAQRSLSENGALLWDVVHQAKSTARKRSSEKALQVGADEDSVRRLHTPSKQRLTPADASDQRTPTRVPFRGVRRATAERVTKSAFTAPHVTAFDDCEATSLVKLRDRWNERLEKEGQRVSYLPFIIKALVSALQVFPYFNARLDDEAQEVVLLPEYHIGIAMDTPDGLFVPVVRNADRLSIREVGEEIYRLSTGVHNRTLAQEDLRGSTFSITNMGPIGSLFITPILNYSEVGIIGTHPIQRKPVVRGDDIVIRDIMTLSLSFDHRVIDGAMSVRFLNHVKNLIEHPEELMLELH
ncbi:dihydrolipoamide acetyltransferase family protein [Alicyclobacillus sp. SO9]|uniref:dihydrolipoamide acetyltransferase family protein n=1 Tax=Alicyclobacillus sp. SO9 TaxID=2665646 RepID=UPI0018E7E3EA|nr:dihydrolipoamide acetyltransferase family protein [Alicyclobacillus sp. SO9]QQE78048.1 2-oxo acid dehydrogenase subunit E2 [Alicyclobacillus sp. SO9]